MPSLQTQIAAYVPDEIAERLKEAAAKRRQSVSTYLRRLLERELKIVPEMPRLGRPPKDVSEPTEKTA